MQIKRISIWTNGDPSAGIGGESCTIEADGDYILDTEDFTPEDIEDFRQELAGIFSSMWDDWGVTVRFDYEEEGL